MRPSRAKRGGRRHLRAHAAGRPGTGGAHHRAVGVDSRWRAERHKIDGNSQAILDALRHPQQSGPAVEFSSAVFDNAAHALYGATDLKHGGLPAVRLQISPGLDL